MTTADEGTWPADGPVLFLGEWCKRYDRRHVWEKLDGEVVPYHWDDREKLYRDYLYLRGLHEELLVELGDAMNAQHGVARSVRYWRIVLGAWLGSFVQILFDRWTMVERAQSEYAISGVRVRETDPGKVVPAHTADFINRFIGDSWNEAIFGQLLGGWSNLSVIRAEPAVDAPALRTDAMATYGSVLRSSILRRAADLAFQILKRDDEAFLMGTYLPRVDEIRLQLRLGQIPKIWRSPDSLTPLVASRTREWRLDATSDDEFSAIARAMIPRHVPSLFVEGYSELVRRVTELPWPKKPRVIFTSSADSSDDLFKSWAAEKAERGTPLIVGQHGGNYGMGRWSFSEDHQCAVSDLWLSWGWDSANEKIRPAGNLKVGDRRASWDPDGTALLVETVVPRYSYHMFSAPVAGQWLDYFDEQRRFVSALPERVRDRLVVRLARTVSDYSWCPAQRWEDCFPAVKVDDGLSPIAAHMKRARICISTSNTTTFLETLALNIPTIVFWNRAHWELREDAIPYFERLKQAGIFYEVPELAARKVGEIWDCVPEWWNRHDVQSARNDFCYRFSRSAVDPVVALQGILTQAATIGATRPTDGKSEPSSLSPPWLGS